MKVSKYILKFETKVYLKKSPHVRSSLINMYAKCNAVDQAKEIMDELLVRDTASWNALISGYAKEGKRKEALQCFDEMQREGCCPNNITFICILKACGDMGAGDFGTRMGAIDNSKQFHDKVIRKEFLHRNDDGNDDVVLDMRMGSIAKSNCIPDEAIIEGFHLGNDVNVNVVLGTGTQAIDNIHDNVIRTGFVEKDINVQCIQDEIFRKEFLLRKDVKFLIGKGIEATKNNHDEAIREDFLGDDVNVMLGKETGTINTINDDLIRKMISEKDVNVVLGMGTGIINNFHGEVGRKEFIEKDVNVGLGMRMGTIDNSHDEVVRVGATGVLNMGTVATDKGNYIFYEAIREESLRNDADVILGIGIGSDKGKYIDDEGIRKDSLVGKDVNGKDVNVVLGTGSTVVDKGKQIHNKAIRKGTLCGKDTDVLCGPGTVAIDKSKHFHNEFLRKYSFLEKDVEGMLGTEMVAIRECKQIHIHDEVTRKGILLGKEVDVVVGTGTGAIDKGKQIHDELTRKGLLFGEDVDVVLGTAVIAMYAKGGKFAEAEHVLDGLIIRNVASWNALIGGYVHYGHHDECMDCYRQMQREGLYPNSITFLSILKVCSCVRALDQGKQFHGDVICRGLLGNDTALGNALIDMYAKCGAIQKAESVIYELPIRNVVSWSILIAGYAQQGLSEEAFSCFQKMQNERISPNHITFVSLLKSCCRVADAENGKQTHHRIVEEGLFEKNLILGNAMIDMYVKCGALGEAKQVFEGLWVRDIVSWNVLITGYAQEGHGEEALNYFQQMQNEGISPNGITMISILKVYGSIGDYDKGKKLHDDFITRDLLAKDFILATALVDMYAKCGALDRAKKVLEEFHVHDLICWTSLITGYVEHGRGVEALRCFEIMQTEGVFPNPVTYVSILRACGVVGDLDMGIRIHKDIVKQGFLGKEDEEIMIGNALIDMYAKCGVVTKAAQVLEELQVRDKVSWNTLIIGYIHQGDDREGLNCFQCMQSEGFCLNTIIIVYILKACGNIGFVEKGQEIHEEIVGRGLGNDLVLGNALINMYVKCGAFHKGEEVFQGLLDKDIGSFHPLLARYAQEGQTEDALKCFESMRSQCIYWDAFTLSCILRACTSIGDIKKGKQIHTEIVSNKLLWKDNGLRMVLIEMYAKWGMVSEAEKILRWLPLCDIDCWSHLITGYCLLGQSKEALACFEEMENEGIHPNAAIFLSILTACGHIKAIEKGKQIHEEIVSKGLLGQMTSLGNALVDMYVKCEMMIQAARVFEELPIRDVVTWNILIGGYSQQLQVKEAMESLENMQKEGIYPNEITFLCILKAGGSLDVHKSESIHKYILNTKMLEKDVMLRSALVNMYAKCGMLGKAEEVLERFTARTVASWNALITGYANGDQCDEAVNCMARMQEEGLSPDVITFIGILKACSHIGAAEIGKKIHNEIVQKGFCDEHLVVGNVLLDMYVKCGSLPTAEKVLEGMFPMQDVVSWNTLIVGYSKQGEIGQALDRFKRMQELGLSPNAITFQCVLSACRNSNLVNEGEVIFMDMNTKHGIGKRLCHYSCMVHMYSDVGNFEKAVEVMEAMPSFNYLPAWHALLSSCHKWNNKEIGRFAFENVLNH